MVTFYLIRHGQKETVMGDPSLSQVGRKQAEYTGKFFKDKKIERIYASPFKRTAETASIISKELNLDIAFDERLRERMNWGSKENETLEDFIKEWQKTDLDRDYQPHHGFSSRESGRRLESFLDEISKELTEGIVLAVTHGGIIGDLLRNVFP
ncbi:MAG: histidine phosphatase family protein, partial [Candidatus Levybacteria bacterium]|nr:histidine phosphatase family protein [Candidatus Levybacteria bacterium]